MSAAVRRNPRPGRHRLESLVAARRLAPIDDSPWLPDVPRATPVSVSPESAWPGSALSGSALSGSARLRPADDDLDPTAPIPRIRVEGTERAVGVSLDGSAGGHGGPPAGLALGLGEPPSGAPAAPSVDALPGERAIASAGSVPSRTAVAPRPMAGAIARIAQRWLPRRGRWQLDPGRRGAIALAVVVLLAAVVAGAVVWRGRPTPEPAPALAVVGESTPSAVDPAASSAEIVVSVAGLVVSPGLVRLPAGARVADAVTAAGGPTPGADLTGVNLARKLTDGEHVVVGSPGSAGQDAGADPVASSSGSRLDLNTATLAELDALPGVGPVTAQKILDWRERHGRFASVDQLREIDGIGETRFARLKDLVLA